MPSGIYERTEAHKRAISEAMKAHHAKRRLEAKKERKDRWKSADASDLVTFQIIYSEGPTEIELDFKSKAISVNVPGIFRLTSDNIPKTLLKDLLRQLGSIYPFKTEERIKKEKKVWRKRKRQEKPKDQEHPKDKIKRMKKEVGKVKKGVMKSIREGNWDQERP